MKRLTTKEFIKRANSVHKGLYGYAKSKYISERVPVIITCPTHGDFRQTPHNHIHQKQGCPECGREYARIWRKGDYKHFVKESEKRFGKVFSFPNIENEYENSHSKVTIKCEKCNKEFIKIAGDHLTSSLGGCPFCNESSIEAAVRDFLDKEGIKYEIQKRFSWLGMQTLDFFLPDYRIGIECQGIQHFEPVIIFGGEESLSKTMERDKKKARLCSENGVNLIYFANFDYNFPYRVINTIEELKENIYHSEKT